MRKTATKLLALSDPEPRGECVLWIGAITEKGYGRVRVAAGELPELPTISRAHRVAFWLWRGPFDLALTVDHTCHTRACVNPYHLRLETHVENSADGAWTRWGGDSWEWEQDAGF